MSKSCDNELPLYIDIERATRENEFYRRVVYTDCKMQVALMRLTPGQEIGLERHMNSTQFFRCETGTGVIMIDGKEYPILPGAAVTVPQKSLHNVINTGNVDLGVYTIYSAPTHEADKIDVVKPS